MTNIISHNQQKYAPLRNKRRARRDGRLFFVIIIILLVGYLLGIMTPLAFSSQQHEDTSAYINETVVYGDTLWSISSRYCDENTNINSLMHDIAKINQLDGNYSLKPGQTLRIPIAESAKRN